MFSKKRLFFGLVVFAFLTLDLGAGFCNEPCMECAVSNFQPIEAKIYK
jgi:hypothetical protein